MRIHFIVPEIIKENASFPNMPRSYVICKFIVFNILEPAMFLPCIGWLISRMRKNFQQPTWLGLFIVTILADVVQGLIFVAVGRLHHNNQWIRHFSQPVLFLGYMWTMYLAAGKSAWRLVATVSMMVLGIAMAILGMRLTGLFLRNSIFNSYASLAFIISSVLCLRDLIKNEEDVPIADMPEFWLFSSFLTLGAGALLFNICSNYFLSTLPESLIALPWLASSIINTFCSVLHLKVFLCPSPRLS